MFARLKLTDELQKHGRIKLLQPTMVLVPTERHCKEQPAIRAENPFDLAYRPNVILGIILAVSVVASVIHIIHSNVFDDGNTKHSIEALISERHGAQIVVNI